MKLKDLLPSFNAEVDIEIKLFEITLFLTTLVFLLWWGIALLANYILQIQTIYFVCLVLYSGLYVAFKRRVSFNIIATIYYTSALIVLLYSWLPSGGVSGIILLMMVLIYISGLLVLPSRGFLVFFVISLIILIFYAIIEFQNPNLALPYASNFDRVRDFSIAGFISLTTIGYSLHIFKKTYSQDRVRLKETIQALEIEKEKALSADKAKTDFLATISHEMRTPLNGIVGISELLKETKLDKDQESLMENLSYSSEHLHSLISDILDVTLIESGKLVMQSNEIDLEKDLQKLIEIVKPRLDKKEGQVEILIEHDQAIPPTIIGDSLKLRQVLLNLINNAIKFTEKGSVSISTKLLHLNDSEMRVQFKITDTGVGISEDGKKQLFSKFYKGALDSNIEGTGLGLSITKNLIVLMGGEIKFESQENIGSSFYFEIPFKHWQKTEEVEIDKELKEKPLQDINILIVEDVRINQIVIKKLAESLGLTSIEVAENGEVAVQKVKSTWYDVILMDIQMPIMDGVEASELITEIYTGKKKPIIIAVTANALVTDQKRYKQAGINGYLSKPITKESLREALSKFI